MKKFTLLSLLVPLVFLFAPAFTNAQSCTLGASCPRLDGSTGVCVAGVLNNECVPVTQTGTNPTQQPTQPQQTGTAQTQGSASNQTQGNSQTVSLVNPLGSGGTIMGFLNSILAFVIKIGTVVIILMLVFVGYKFVAAQGVPGAISEARSQLLWTVIGALILLGAQAISLAIQATVTAISTGT